jgi:coproporphyrinogen III oxidase
MTETIPQADWTDATARARVWFDPARSHLRRIRSDRTRSRQRCVLYLYAVESRACRGTRRKRRRRGAGPDERQGVRESGVNVSTVGGAFSPEFARTINGADPENPTFTATGISLVAHMANPHVPAVHMNTRFLTTRKAWFGGGGDLNPPIPMTRIPPISTPRSRRPATRMTGYPGSRRGPTTISIFPTASVHRGVGGFSTITSNARHAAFEANFAFTRDVGEAFLDVFPRLVRRRMGMPFERKKRSNSNGAGYAEFNLVHDRGTLFGLKTGGNIDAILMSLPPARSGLNPMAIAHDGRASLAQGFHAVAPGDLAAVVTALEMREPPASCAAGARSRRTAATGALDRL